ncbi:MAG: ArsI/CadI family heavy metal resistance metalloenzyme [Burkholderiaceae bacterium]|nr:ArsI/CadI family heavy metal resistance metalloenzyme [Burkholderiaceae bacterium]
MKRFHVHVSVPDLAQSIRFYSTLFGAAPAVVKSDYAKWMLEDPRVNFAISQRSAKLGINHLGLQTDSDAELEGLNAQLQAADLATAAEKETACCYARSNKYWVTDPTGIAWETFHTLGDVPTFNDEAAAHGDTPSAEVCCTPAPAVAKVAARIPVKAAGGCCN